MNKEQIKTNLQQYLDDYRTFGKWLVISILCGIIIGFAETAFCYSVNYVTDLRTEHPAIIIGLPFGGLMMIGLYRLLHNENDAGTNLIFASVRSGDHVPLRMLPCIFLSAVATHLFGGSAGRAGATLQIGGSIGSAIGKRFRLDPNDQSIIIMCGMSAAFSVLFGVPIAAAVFPMEVVSVGKMQYFALFPCVAASFTAFKVGTLCGMTPCSFSIASIPPFSAKTGCLIIVLAICCALVSRLFCAALHKSGQIYERFFKDAYIRIAVGGIIVVILTVLVGNQAYNGAGTEHIGELLEKESVFPAAFLLKILFTACTMRAGFKGGEIGPAFYIGASFGCFFGMVSGFSTNLCIAAGMAAVFCGVTNSPFTSLLICLEFFGCQGMPYYLLAIAVSYTLSGSSSLYSYLLENN